MRKVIAIGGSTGGLQALCTILRQLPSDFPAPVLVVIHIAEGGNLLTQILQRCTQLKVISPLAPEPLVEGKVYVAAPNRHMIIQDTCVLSVKGPRENRHRPAIDALLRSAARAHRHNLIAVVLSGSLDDGVAGCLAAQIRGGTVVVQEPGDAQNSELPENVLSQMKQDYCLPAKEIGQLLLHLAVSAKTTKERPPTKAECASLAENENVSLIPPAAFTCPECGGTLVHRIQGKSEQFRCTVGHVYSTESFSADHSEALERALWMSIQKLNERKSIQERLAERTRDESLTRRYRENAAAAAKDIELLKEIVQRL